MKKITVIGNTTWGFTLSFLISENIEHVTILTRSVEEKDLVNQTRTHHNLSKTMKLPLNVNADNNVSKNIKESNALILAVPSHTLLNNLIEIKDYLGSETFIISATKGITSKGLRMSELINTSLPNFPKEKIGVLSGPNLAYEISQGLPSISTVAFENINFSNYIRDSLSSNNFRIYSGTDLIGTELGGALKNIIAIGAGIIDGLNLGINAKSAFVTRGLYEITKLGISLGAKASTFAGSSGMGDLITSCFGSLSRNWKLGVALSQGLSVEKFMKQSKLTVEGVQTTLAAVKLGKKYNINIPITATTAKVLNQEISIDLAIKELMNRDLTEEWTD